MELRHLRYFVAVADRLNFRQAAEQLHVTQPALSAQIKSLEAELGVRLLERNTRQVRLTDAGAVLLEHARRLLDGSREAVHATLEAARARRGRLTVGNISAFSTGFMSPNLAAFRQRYPDVDVTLVPLGMHEHIPALEAGRIQVGFTLGPRDPFPRTIRQLSLLRTPLRALVGRTHRLAAASRVKMAELAREPLLAISYDNYRVSLMETQLRAIFTNHGLSLREVRRVDGFESILTILASGLGFILMPEIVTATLPAKIVCKPIADEGPDLLCELKALWHRQEPSRLVRNFIASLARWSREHHPAAVDAPAPARSKSPRRRHPLGRTARLS